MPPLFWCLLSAYLIVAAASVVQSEFRSREAEPIASIKICIVALLFAGTWPLRVVFALAARARG